MSLIHWTLNSFWSPICIVTFTPYNVDSSPLEESASRKLPSFTVAGKKIFIKETLADPHTVITPEDEALRAVIENLVSGLSVQPTIGEIVDTINEAYPRDPSVTAHIRKYRQESSKSKPLGEYFQPQEDMPYAAVCVHKAILAQALLSFYDYNSSLISFGFGGQMNQGVSDGEAGMHSVLRTGAEGKSIIADPHKGICESELDYFKRFKEPQLFDPLGIVLFTPEQH